jgi:WD40 repeat protein
MSQLENLLQHCTVKLTLTDRQGWGTGFFVAPGLILTCAHVVRKAKGQSVQVRWKNQDNWAQALVEKSLPDPYDLALLRVTLPTNVNPPCVYLDQEIQSRDPLYLFGYPDQDFPNGCPVTFHCEGFTGDEPPLIKFALGQVRPGMSGSPLLNQRTGKVCGIVKFTRDRSIDLGGGAIPTRVILEQFPQLQNLQDRYHQQDRRWIDAEKFQTIVGGNKNNIKIYVFASASKDGEINWAQYRTESQSKAVEPYKFLSYYDTTDADLFFGREAISQQLAAKITSHKLVLINGKSGSGKTSLINAGIIPLLVVRGYFTMVFRDYGYPTETIKASLASLQNTSINLSGSKTLLDCLQATIQQTKRPVAIFLDQFERFFINLPTDQREQFVKELKDCFNAIDAQDMNIVISLREDFYGKLGEFWQDIPEFNTESYHQYLEPLNAAEAKDAIEKPLEKMQQVNVWYDSEFLADSLVPHLLHRSEGESNQQVEPVHLQIVCNRLFEEVRVRYHDELQAGKPVFIKQDLYEELGRVEGILQGYVEVILKQLYPHSREKQDEVKTVLKQMVTSQGTREFKSVVNIAENTGLAEARVTEIIQQLDQSRLIETVPAEVDAHRKYSITHEYLAIQINQWYTLNDLELKRARELYKRCLDNWKDPKNPTYIPRSQLKFLQNYKPALLKWKPEGKQLFRASEWRYHGLNCFVIAVFAALVGATFWALNGQRNAVLGEIRASRQASEALFSAGDQQLEALAEALKAGTLLQRHWLLYFLKPNQHLQTQVRSTLWKAFYQTQEQARLWHDSWVTSAKFHQDGGMVVTASTDGTAKVWDLEGEKQPLLLKHNDGVYSAKFSPDGKKIVTASKDGTAKLWGLKGELLATFEHNGVSVSSAEFSPDGRKIVTASIDGIAKVWNLEKQQPLLLEYGDGIFSMEYETASNRDSAEFNQDGSRLVTLSGAGVAKVWDLENEQQPLLLEQNNSVNDAEFSSDGSMVVTASEDGNARIWNLEGKGELLTILEHSDAVTSAVFSSDDNMIVTASEDGKARIWKLDGEDKPLTTLEHGYRVNSVEFSSDGSMIVTASRDQKAKVWNLEGKLLVTFEHSGVVSNAEFSRDSRMVLTASDEGNSRVWNLEGLQQPLLLENSDGVASAEFSRDGNRIVNASNHEKVMVWDLEGELLKLATLEQSGWVYITRSSPDGRKIATASNDQKARVWNLEGELLTTLDHNDTVTDAEFSPDSRKIVTTTHNGKIRIWNLGRKIVTTTHNGKIRIWNLESELLVSLKYDGYINDVKFSPDSSSIITDTGDGKAKIWNLEGELLATLEHGSSVSGAEFSPDTSIVVTTSSLFVFDSLASSADRVAKMWSIEGKLLAILEHNSAVTSAEFSPDGTMIVTSSNKARVWAFPHLPKLTVKACNRIHGYLKNYPAVDEGDRDLCDGVPVPADSDD